MKQQVLSDKKVRVVSQNKHNKRILADLKSDLKALENGTLQTRPAKEFLEELKEEGYL